MCGRDPYTGKDYEHRRDWVRDRVRELAGVFSVEVCAYAIMSNHSHFVLWCRPSVAETWSAEEVARRWLRLFGRPEGGRLEEEVVKLAADADRVAVCRGRLGSVSWFMRCLNERIARRANAEDECTGRFWEGRFKCQLLEDEGAVLACMAYVDLNPVRAKLAETLEASEFTSIHDRLVARRARAGLAKVKVKVKAKPSPTQERMMEKARSEAEADAWLCLMGGSPGASAGPTVLDISEEGYLALVDWTGRSLATGKRGRIPIQSRGFSTTKPSGRSNSKCLALSVTRTWRLARHCAASRVSSHGNVRRMDLRKVKTRFHSTRQWVSTGSMASAKSRSVSSTRRDSKGRWVASASSTP